MTILVTWTPYDVGGRDADLLADPFAGIDTNGVAVGADPLAAIDGDTSYVEVAESTQGTTFQLAPDRPVPSGSLVELWWEATYRIIGSPTFGADYRVWINGPDIRGSYADENAPERPSTYTSVPWFHLTPAYNGDAADMLLAAVEQPDTLYALIGPAGATVRVTFLRMFSLHLGGNIPLRQFHRDDGLGVTPPRAFGGASRIRTGRAYGYD